MGLNHKVHLIAALSDAAGLVTALIVYGTGIPGLSEAGGFVLLLAPGGLYSTTSLVAFIASSLSGLVTIVAIPFANNGYVFEGYAEGAAAAGAATSAKPSAESDVEVTVTSSA